MEYDKVNGHATPGTTYHFVENREIYSEHVTLVCLWRGQTHGDTGRQSLKNQTFPAILVFADNSTHKGWVSKRCS